MIQVFVFNILFCFDMFVIFFLSTGWVGLLDRLINKQITHIYSTSTSKYCNMSSKPERAYPTPYKKDESFQSIKYQFTPDPNSFLRITYLRGKYILLFFSCIKPRPFKQKWKVSEVTIQDVWRGDTKHHTHSIYIYTVYVVYTYILLSWTEL